MLPRHAQRLLPVEALHTTGCLPLCRCARAYAIAYYAVYCLGASSSFAADARYVNIYAISFCHAGRLRAPAYATCYDGGAAMPPMPVTRRYASARGCLPATWF